MPVYFFSDMFVRKNGVSYVGNYQKMFEKILFMKDGLLCNITLEELQGSRDDAPVEQIIRQPISTRILNLRWIDG